jgi:hypothetical protein
VGWGRGGEGGGEEESEEEGWGYREGIFVPHDITAATHIIAAEREQVTLKTRATL